jgi:hypothetical protein
MYIGTRIATANAMRRTVAEGCSSAARCGKRNALPVSLDEARPQVVKIRARSRSTGSMRGSTGGSRVYK